VKKNFRGTVQQAWETAAHGIPSGNVLAWLNHLHEALHEWDKSMLKDPKKILRKAQREFKKAVSGVISDDSEAKAKEMAELIELLLEKEEIRWLQISRANWLSQGDRNTSFFHNFATVRWKKNYIKKLKNDDGDWVEGSESLKPLVFQYFSNLFASEVQDTDPAFLDKITPKVTNLMNKGLIAPFSTEEVKKATLSIGDFKAPGPDGLHAVFYKKIGTCAEKRLLLMYYMP
jgi:hypothetical protein